MARQERDAMEKFLAVVKFLSENGPDLLTAVVGILTGVALLAMYIPGDQPEKALKTIAEFLGRFSRKPAPKLPE